MKKIIVLSLFGMFFANLSFAGSTIKSAPPGVRTYYLYCDGVYAGKIYATNQYLANQIGQRRCNG